MGNCANSPITQISMSSGQSCRSFGMFASNESVLPIKTEIEDKIMVQKIPVLYDKSNNSNIRRKSDRLSNSRSTTGSDRNGDHLNHQNQQQQQQSDDDIVIINEVKSQSTILGLKGRPKRAVKEPVLITRIGTESETKPSLKRKFSDSRQLRSQTQRTICEEIIVKKIK